MVVVTEGMTAAFVMVRGVEEGTDWLATEDIIELVVVRGGEEVSTAAKTKHHVQVQFLHNFSEQHTPVI